jgi:hypothetical protein
MPQRQQFFEDMAGENRQAALLVAQVGGMPTELQLITQVAEYDEDAEGLRPIRTYIIRVNGVMEHRIVGLGVTVADVRLTDDHPLLYEYTHDPAAVFFKGQPDEPDAMVLDIAQAHASTFQGWRPFPAYLNVQQPLAALARSGGGLLGQMPRPLADKLVPVLDRHGLENRVMFGQAHTKQATGPLASQTLQALLLGESYFISYAFSFEIMRGRGAKPDG